MKIHLIWAFFILIGLQSLSALEFNVADHSFQTAYITFDLNPVLAIRSDPTHTEVEDFALSHSEMIDNTVLLEYASNGFEMTVEVNLDGDLLPDWHRVQVSVTALDDRNIWTLGLKPTFSQAYSSLKAPKAIMNNDATQNRDLNPFMQRNIEYDFAGGVLGFVASNLGDTPGIEMYYDDTLFFYHYIYHWANFTTYYGINIDWRPIQAGETLEYQFVITESKPLLPYINPYPAGKKAAIAITHDADCQGRSLARAMYWGSSDMSDDIYGTRGLIPNNIRHCHTVFSCNYDTIGDYWMDLMEAGSTIGMHTFEPEEDDMQALEESLHNEMAPFNIRMWIDHSWGLNPEDICRDGCNPESEFYVMDILENAGIEYAWIGNNYFSHTINSFDDPRQLPHRLYAFEPDREIWYYERLRCEFWMYNMWPMWGFFHNVTYSNIQDLLETNGIIQPYTHFFITDNSVRQGFLYHDEANGRWIVRDDVERCLEMLDDFQQNHGLWIVPTEPLFDRLRAVDSVYVTEIYEDRESIRYTLYNGSSSIIDDFEVQLQDDCQSIARFYPHTDFTLEFEYFSADGETDDTPVHSIRSFIRDRHLHVQTVGRDISLKSVGVFNIRGQRIAKADHLNTDYWKYDMSRLPSGVYLIRITDSDNRQQLTKQVYVK